MITSLFSRISSVSTDIYILISILTFQSTLLSIYLCMYLYVCVCIYMCVNPGVQKDFHHFSLMKWSQRNFAGLRLSSFETFPRSTGLLVTEGAKKKPRTSLGPVVYLPQKLEIQRHRGKLGICYHPQIVNPLNAKISAYDN